MIPTIDGDSRNLIYGVNHPQGTLGIETVGVQCFPPRLVPCNVSSLIHLSLLFGLAGEGSDVGGWVVKFYSPESVSFYFPFSRLGPEFGFLGVQITSRKGQDRCLLFGEGVGYLGRVVKLFDSEL